jgi:hypothetical protein
MRIVVFDQHMGLSAKNCRSDEGERAHCPTGSGQNSQRGLRAMMLTGVRRALRKLSALLRENLIEIKLVKIIFCLVMSRVQSLNTRYLALKLWPIV